MGKKRRKRKKLHWWTERTSSALRGRSRLLTKAKRWILELMSRRETTKPVRKSGCAGMGRLQPITDNYWQQNKKPEKSPLSTPASSEAVRPCGFSIRQGTRTKTGALGSAPRRKRRSKQRQALSLQKIWQNLFLQFKPKRRRRSKKRPLAKKIGRSCLKLMISLQEQITNLFVPKKRRRRRKSKQYAVYVMANQKKVD